MQRLRVEARVKLPRHHHAVAAVVPLAAQHHDALGGERRETFRQEFHHAMPGVFHQDDAGDSHPGRPPVHFAHLSRG